MSETTDPNTRDELAERRLFDELLAGRVPSSEDPRAGALAEVLGALTAPAAPGELAGEAAALAAFRESVAARPTSHRLRRATMLTSLLSAKALLAAGAAVAAVGGTTVAAYAGALPDPLQSVAHTVIGAPPAHSTHAPSSTPAGGSDVTASVAASPSSKPTTTPVGPDVSTTSPAYFGLCMAWNSGAGANMSPNSTVFKNLYAATGATESVDPTSPGSMTSARDDISKYCNGVAPSGKPTDQAGGPSQSPSHPSGRPTSMPSHSTGMPPASELPTQASMGASAAASAQANH